MPVYSVLQLAVAIGEFVYKICISVQPNENIKKKSQHGFNTLIEKKQQQAQLGSFFLNKLFINGTERKL